MAGKMWMLPLKVAESSPGGYGSAFSRQILAYHVYVGIIFGDRTQ
jgi:hypothetical protein